MLSNQLSHTTDAKQSKALTSAVTAHISKPEYKAQTHFKSLHFLLIEVRISEMNFSPCRVQDKLNVNISTAESQAS